MKMKQIMKHVNELNKIVNEYVCYHRDKPGHFAIACPEKACDKSETQHKPSFTCYSCKQPVHYAKRSLICGGVRGRFVRLQAKNSLSVSRLFIFFFHFPYQAGV